MKATIPYCFVSLIAWTSGIIVFCATTRVQAADLYWNPGETGGSGIWGISPSEKNWNFVPGAPAGNITWPDTIDSVAIFQDLSGGVVTLSDPLQSAGIIQNGADYSINAGVITLVPNSAANNPFIFVQDGVLTIDSVLAGSNGLIKTGVGTLTLTGSNSLSGNTQIGNGTLTLSGTLASNMVGITSGATLTNAGSLTLNVDNTVTGYLSNGGMLTVGAGTLFTTSAALNNGSTLAGLLNTGTLTSNGAVQVSGTIFADGINIATGKLTNSGTLGNGSTLLNINQGATLNAGGIQQYSLLTTSGAGTGTWLGNLENTRKVAPGGLNGIGVLAIEGNFTQSAGGTLTMDLSATANDRLDVTGSAAFNGSLVLNQLGATPIAPFVPITIVSASGYSGSITSFSESLSGAVWFNPGNGTVTRIELPLGKNSFSGSTRNQTSTWISLYDDAIDPGITNITPGSGGYEISSGIADIGNPDLQWALAASFTPGGLNAALLNRLSPEVYSGLSDYATQATRAHQRSALSAPALDPRDDTKSGMGLSAKDGAKSGVKSGIAAAPLDWEFFAAMDYFRAGTDNSRNQGDYDFDGMGVLTGARTRPTDNTQLGMYFGVDSGTLSGELIDADAFGWNSGMLGEYVMDEKSRTRLTAGMSFGSYAYDGSRGSASATAAGWSPGTVDFDDVEVDAFDLFVGVDGVAWKQQAHTLIPSVGLRYVKSTMDSFNESTGGAPGSPIALDVSRDRHEALLLEIGLQAQTEVNSKLALWGEGGANFGLLDEGRVLAASFAKGGRAMSAEVDGLNDDSLYLGFGVAYQIFDNVQACIGYRADIRSEARAQQEVRISSSWRF